MKTGDEGMTGESHRRGAAWAPSPSPGGWGGCSSPGARPPRGSQRDAGGPATPRGGAAPGGAGRGSLHPLVSIDEIIDYYYRLLYIYIWIIDD